MIPQLIPDEIVTIVQLLIDIVTIGSGINSCVGRLTVMVSKLHGV